MKNKSDFDDLVNAIKLNIMNSYSQFRNKKDVDFGDWGEGNKKKDPTKLDIPSAKKRPTGADMGGDDTDPKNPSTKPLASNRGALGSKESGLMYQRGGKQQRLGGDTRIYGSRQANRQDPANRAVAREEAEKNPPKPKQTNRYQVDEKGNYKRGTGYEKPVTGSTTRESKRRSGSETSSQSREAHPQNRTYRRDEQKLQDAQRLGQGSGGGNWKKGTIQEDRIFGAETQDPAPPHRHLREQDKEGKVVRNRYSTDPHNVKPIKGGKKKDPKEAETAVRQGMQNLKGKALERYIMRSMDKVKANLDELMKKLERSPITGENYETEGGEGSKVPARNLGTDERFRGKPAGVIHKKPKDEAEQGENKRGKELARNQWDKDFAMHYIAPDKKEIDRYMKFRKALKALMQATLSPISFTYKYKGWGNTYERGQTKQVETQDHSRTGNTNNKQFYENKPEISTNKPSKEDLTIKSLDQVYSEWTKKRNER